MMRFSLTMLFALIALLAVEIATLKNPLEAVAPVLEFFLSCCVLLATWGAFCLHGNAKRFCLGFAVMFWAYFFYSYFNALGPYTLGSNHLCKLVYDFLGHKQVEDPIAALQRGDFLVDSNWFLIYWKLWSYLNIGLLGGLLAVNYNGIVPAGSKLTIAEKDPIESSGN